MKRSSLPEIEQKGNIVRVMVRSRELQEDTVRMISSLFTHNTGLVLELSNTFDRKCTPEVVQHIAKLNLPNFTTWDLGINRLYQRGPDIAKTVAKIPSLVTLGLSFNDLKEHALPTAQKLAESNSIRVVNMYENDISINDAIKIAKIFACRENPIKLGIEPEAHEHIRKAISEINAEMHPYLNSAMEPFIPPELPKLLGLMQEYADPYYIEFMNMEHCYHGL